MLREIPQIKQQASFFDLCFKNALLTNHKVALWRLPNESVKHVALDLNKEEQIHKFNFESSSPGFILSPFVNREPGKIAFIKSDIYFESEHPPEQQPDWEKYLRFSTQFGLDSFGTNTSPLEDTGSTTPGGQKQEYILLIEKALAGIREDIFKKVVVARNKLINTAFDIDPVNLFDKLCEKYNTAFVSLIYHPSYGCWIGATPEVLASIEKDQTFRTIALAGTQRMNKDMDLSQITWSHKEIEEQAYVNRYIAHCFKALGLRDYEENGPQTVAAGNLAHLRTDFSLNITKAKLPALGTKMLDLLHPTSAVCGMPKQSSMDFICGEEGFDRELYSGFLGPVNIEGRSNIFVNIRCAKLYRNRALLYAGAGITKDSDPEKEWVETEMKMNTIHNVLMP